MALLNGKTAIVTGASSGIGRAAALLFAREGARVVAGARRRHELETLVHEIETAGGEARFVAGDVCDDAFAAELVDTACSEFGGLDVAFNNAGTLGALGASTDVPLDGWHRTLDTNLTSAFLAARRQLPALLARGGGSLIFTSTFVGHTAAFPGTAAYAASKAGVVGLTQALAVEYGPRGVRVNALLPGGTDTPMGRSMNPSPEAQAAVAALHALKRIARPEEQARAALYLASDLSSFMTGAVLLVDGGVSVNRS